MNDAEDPQIPLPPSVDRILSRFQQMGREEKMQALVAYARRLEPVPERFRALPRGEFSVPECQTPVDIYPELRDGILHFWADVNAKQSPTVAAFLSILFSAINGQPPATTLALPTDVARRMMDGIGLAAREQGLNALVARVKRYARDTNAAER